MGSVVGTGDPGKLPGLWTGIKAVFGDPILKFPVGCCGPLTVQLSDDPCGEGIFNLCIAKCKAGATRLDRMWKERGWDWQRGSHQLKAFLRFTRGHGAHSRRRGIRRLSHWRDSDRCGNQHSHRFTIGRYGWRDNCFRLLGSAVHHTV